MNVRIWKKHVNCSTRLIGVSRRIEVLRHAHSINVFRYKHVDLSRCYAHYRLERGVTGLVPETPKRSCLAEPSMHLARPRHKTHHIWKLEERVADLFSCLFHSILFFFPASSSSSSSSSSSLYETFHFHSQRLKWPSVWDFHSFTLGLIIRFYKMAVNVFSYFCVYLFSHG